MDEILNVARTEHATNHLEIQPLQLAQVLQEVYDLTHLLAANSNFPLQVSLLIQRFISWQTLVGCGRCSESLDTCISQMKEGSIYVSTQLTPAAETSVHIWLDVQLPAHLV